MITIESPSRLLVDGKLSGAVIDSLVNLNLKPSDVQRALQACWDAKDAATAELQASASAQATVVTTLTNAILAVRSAPDHDAAKAIAVEATRSAVEKRRAALDAQIAALQKEKSEL